MNPAAPSSPLAELRQPPRINPAGLVFLVAAFALIGTFLVQRFGNVEEEREMLRWQNRLNLIADSRVADVDGWLDRHFKELGEVASNPSLQLYLTALANPQKPENSEIPAGLMEEPSQAIFLRNLLLMTSDRMGFTAKKSDDLKDIRANVGRVSGTGLGIVGADGKIMVATQGLGTLDASLAAKVAAAPLGKATLIDMFRNASTGQWQIGFVLPIYPIQGDAKAEQQIGKLIGVKNVNDELFGLLVQPGVADKTLQALLIRKEGDNVIYVGAPQGDVAAQPTQFALSTPELDAAYAYANPGSFAVKRDAESNRVLMTSRTLTHAPWLLLLHIDRDEALRDSDNWRDNMKYVMGFALLALICAIVAAWWYGSSRRATLLSIQTAKLAAFSIAQERLLRVVSDNQPEPIFIADANQKIRFANQKTSERFKLSVNDIIGKSIAALMNSKNAQDYTEANNTVLSSQHKLSRIHRMGEGLETRTFNSTHIPLDHVPVEGTPYPTPGVLVVDEDVTDIVLERERRERILHQLINTLVRMVDARDPYSANHSQAVSLAAREVAQGLGLSPLLTETARIAGKIMNIGKVVVPAELLTRKKTLAKDEIQTVRDGLMQSVSLLNGIEFDGPVVNTLRQCSEWVNGSGPLGLKGDDILITARIIAVANSFVGMISPRSYRDALTIELATGNLLQNVDMHFDRKVVVALINFVENKQGRESLLKLVAKK